MKLRVIERKDIEQIRKWRNEAISYLRTPFQTTEKMQEDWYEKIVSDRNNKYRFYAIDDIELIGYGGLDIQWENRFAEIALVIGQEYQRKGYGEKAVDLLLYEAFNKLNLDNVCGETYRGANPMFWLKIADKYKAYITMLPNRKYSNGEYNDSIYFNISRENYDNIQRK